MPGFLVANTPQMPQLVNYAQERCVRGEMRCGEWTIRWNVLNKYQDDKIFEQTDTHVIVLDGVILNKNELIRRLGGLSWVETVQSMIRKKRTFFEDFRGAFSGAVYDKENGEWILFTDQLNMHLLLKCADKGRFAFGSQMNYLADWMRCNNIHRDMDPMWQEDVLTYGYMLDVHTALQGVERVFPGSYFTCNANGFGVEHAYYRVTKQHRQDMSMQKAIELLDEAFDNAVRRVLDKDREYGYKTVVDISGGLDSRMILCSAQKQAPGQIFCINYAQSRSDDRKLAETAVHAAGVQGMFFSMDDGRCLLDVDDLVLMNQGLSYYSGITGGKQVLESLDPSEYGAELFGILGDVYEGAMISQELRDKPDWSAQRFMDSLMLAGERKYCDARREYEDNELLWFYVRGMFAGMNTAFIRQNFCEAITPFGDVEFMDLCFSLSEDMRVKHHVYRRWMMQKYPKMARISYARTGLPVMTQDRLEKLLTLFRRAYRKLYYKLCGSAPWEMNPLDNWYKSPQIGEYLREYYCQNIDVLQQDPDFRHRVELLFDQGNAQEKTMALTAISAVKQYVNSGS